MVRSRNNSTRSIVVEEKVKVEASLARFTTFDSIQHLDVDRLKAVPHATFEVGVFEGGCCRRMVRAVVKKGMVTKLEIEPCEEGVRLTPELKKVMQSAWKKLAKGGGRPTSLPVPLTTFLARAMGITIEIFGCIYICAFGYCLLCCINTSPFPGPENGCKILKDPHKKSAG
jgi:hypothetical protein